MTIFSRHKWRLFPDCSPPPHFLCFLHEMPENYFKIWIISQDRRFPSKTTRDIASVTFFYFLLISHDKRTYGGHTVPSIVCVTLTAGMTFDLTGSIWDPLTVYIFIYIPTLFQSPLFYFYFFFRFLSQGTYLDTWLLHIGYWQKRGTFTQNKSLSSNIETYLTHYYLRLLWRLE